MLGSKKIFIGLILSSVLMGCSSNNEPPKTKEQLAAEQKEKDKQKLTKLMDKYKLTVEGDASTQLVEAVIEAIDEEGKNIEKANLNNGELTLYLKPQDGHPYLTISFTAKTSYDFIKELKKQGVNSLITLKTIQPITYIDKYNNKVEKETYDISYNYPEVMKFNDKNYSSEYSYLKFAKYNAYSMDSAGMLLDYCSQVATGSVGEFCNIK